MGRLLRHVPPLRSHHIGQHLATLQELQKAVSSGLTPRRRAALIHLSSVLRLEQRQIVRLLLTPFIFALGSTLSYIFFRKQEYFEVIRDGYEGLCIAAFLVL